MKFLIVALATLSLMACTDKGSSGGSSGSPNNSVLQQSLAECPQDLVGTYERVGSGRPGRDYNDDYTGYNRRGYQQQPQPPIYPQSQPQPQYQQPYQTYPSYQQRGTTTVTVDANSGVLVILIEGRDMIRTDGIPRQSGSGETFAYTCRNGKIIGRNLNEGRRGPRREITGGYDQMQVRSNGGIAETYRRIR